MKSHDHLLDKQYDEEDYNCVHFAHEAALDLYGIDRGEALELFMQPKGKITFLPSRLKLLNPLPMPKEGCIVAFHSRQRNKPPHVGLFRLGRVLHLMEGGVTYLAEDVIKAMGFSRVSYYD
ncbi:hypothetical protein PU912_12970 [Acinetobacter baumannii]|uniref:hypothetical protein n=1 Tax=Acinetobacter baumannii TaxID=470 RepID=UPI0021BD1B06|nr:hypothetical protein [Acinetobacter baumannii]MCT9189014.1 hypothetical protein [Acinetobacter baumannii]MDC4724360.1 hypothetical protein [Acinetobacter baumannii]MDC4794153.1 hypothetical protein [Acinetobacter baumannii]MDC4976563.1 hypothetical protein [Acinetobacter baumannii]MDC5122293.1 hypothetical protein [Acinetobacter baumannii]